MDDKLHLELATLEEELSKLKNSVEYIESAKISVEAAKKIIAEAKILQSNVAENVKIIETLIQKLDKVDFPARLDKIDTVIATINQNISNLQSRLESIEQNIRDEVKQRVQQIFTEMEKFSAQNQSLISRITKRQNIHTGFLIFLIVLVVSFGLLFKFNLL